MRIRNILQQQVERLFRRNPRLRWVLTVLLVVLAAVFGRTWERPAGGPIGPGESGSLSGFVKLVDGDSFRLGGSEVRLVGIDAPEGRQTCQRAGRDWDCGEEARRQLQRLIGGQKVVCRSVERDKHGRYLGTCEAGGRVLNAAMVESGFAVSYGDYRAEERAARAARRGMWSGTSRCRATGDVSGVSVARASGSGVRRERARPACVSQSASDCPCER